MENFTLDRKLVDHPPVILWPEAKENADLPADAHELAMELAT